MATILEGGQDVASIIFSTEIDASISMAATFPFGASNIRVLTFEAGGMHAAGLWSRVSYLCG